MLSIVLKRTNFREADQLISLYTDERGKVEVLARGIKKITSKNSMALEPFAVVDVDLVPGKEIEHLTTAQVVESFSNIRGDLFRLTLGGIALQLVDTHTQVGVAESGIFRLLHSYLTYLHSTPAVTLISMSMLALRLLSLLGFTPTFDVCPVCGREWGSATLVFSLADGGAIHSHCVRPTNGVVYLATDSAVQTALRDMLTVPWDQEQKNETALHDLVYQFALYHSGRALPDWRAIARPL